MKVRITKLDQTSYITEPDIYEGGAVVKFSKDKVDKEVDVLGIFKKMLHEWKTILLFVLFFAILGVVSVFVTNT